MTSGTVDTPSKPVGVLTSKSAVQAAMSSGKKYKMQDRPVEVFFKSPGLKPEKYDSKGDAVAANGTQKALAPSAS